MHISLLTDAVEFARRTADIREAEHLSANVISVVLERALNTGAAPHVTDRWIIAEEGAAPVGIAMLNGPYNLFACRQADAAAAAIIEAVVESGLAPPGVTAEARVAERAAARWCELTGQHAELQIAHTVYALEGRSALTGTAAEQSTARAAGSNDIAVLAGWLDAFHAEALPHDPPVDNSQVAASRIAAGEIWLCEFRDAPVAMAAISHPAAGVARVGPVYTPPDNRGRGFAAIAVAAACQHGFDLGSTTVMLYADQTNPTSNGLYRRLGFRPDHEAADYGFRV